MYLFVDSYADTRQAMRLAETIKRSSISPDKVQILTPESTGLASVTIALCSKSGAHPQYRLRLMLAVYMLLITRAMYDWAQEGRRSLIVGGRASLLAIWKEIPDEFIHGSFDDAVVAVMGNTKNIVVYDPDFCEEGIRAPRRYHRSVVPGPVRYDSRNSSLARTRLVPLARAAHPLAIENLTETFFDDRPIKIFKKFINVISAFSSKI